MRSRLISAMLGCLLPGLFGTAAAETVTASVTLKSGVERELNLLPSRRGNWLRVEFTGMASRVSYNLDDVASIQFNFAEPMEKVRDSIDAGDFTAAANKASELLTPYLYYLSASNNLHDAVMAMLFAQFAAGDDQGLQGTINRLQAVWNDPQDQWRLKLYTVLWHHTAGRSRQAHALFSTLEPVDEASDDFPPYAYALSLLRMDNGEWLDALLVLSRTVTKHYRDHYWTPHTLYQSGRAYWKIRELEAVNSVKQQMQLTYPDHPMTRKMARIENDFPYPSLKAPSFEIDPPVEGGADLPAPWRVKGGGETGADVRVVTAAAVDNGLIPDGTSTLSVSVAPGSPPVEIVQTVTGLQPGQTYFISLYENASAVQGLDAAGPYLEVLVDEHPVVASHLVKPVQGPHRHDRPFRHLVGEPFVALAGEQLLRIRCSAGAGISDRPRTAYLDHLEIWDWEIHKEQVLASP